MLKSVKKRGQVTIFVIIAILVVVVVLLLTYFLVIKKTPKKEEIPSLKSQINDFLESQVLTNTVRVMLQGGKAYPQDYFSTPLRKVEYWAKGKTNTSPSLHEIESEIDLLNEGITDFNLSDLFPEENISTGTLKSNTSILPDKVITKITCPITLNQGTSSQRFEAFTFEYNLRYGRLYNASIYTIEYALRNEVPTEMPKDMNLTVYVYDHAILYEIIDLNDAFTLEGKHPSMVFGKLKS